MPWDKEERENDEERENNEERDEEDEFIRAYVGLTSGAVPHL